jgi:hypothetical protein
MDIKIGYKKRNGETSGTIIRIDNDGFIYLVGVKTGERTMESFTLGSDYEKGSAVILGVDYDDSQTT